MEDNWDESERVDINGFMLRLKEAWKIVPDLNFGGVIELVFNGYDLRELSSSEMEDMLDEFIMQNQ
jgi:hypothetical protein